MGNTSYSPIYSYIKANLSRALSTSDYELLMNMPSLKEFSLHLFNKYFIAQIQDRSIDNISISYIEHLLKQELIAHYQRKVSFLQGEPRIFITKLIKTYFELANIKILLRNVTYGQYEFDDIKKYFFIFPNEASFPFNTLRNIKNAGQVIFFVENTSFKNNFNGAFVQFQKDNNTAVFEDFLLREFFKIISARSKCLSSEDSSIVLDYSNRYCDIVNVHNFLRTFFIYESKDVKLLDYGKIEKSFYESLKDMQLKQAIAALHEKLKTGIVPAQEDHKSNEEIIEEFKAVMENMFFIFCKNMIYFKPFTIAPVLSSLYLKKVEIKNIMRIMTNLELKVSPELIKKKLLVR